ncbi:class I SAM-dependent methyltransferase [Caulobacter segnis]|uniref:class I SAM-dependent methyltransferase n=1 Tax=Caulobacter segnis TaxID=88688 RepID=UPI00240F03B9|nr:class I SAM-dependent methyltransferase [Caulobacter segnis]MDG2522182.1 class I SAM-dependent methyltransferase [Caulobacter segnis]
MTRHASFSTSHFFNQDMAEAYDQRNSGLKPISDSLHFLMALLLKDLPRDARALCVGVGTGAEILSLAKAFPDWTFVGVDPSAEMLSVGRHRLEQARVLDRCELIHGYADAVTETGFDVVVTLLVAHFIKRDDRPAFYAALHDRLKSGGRLVSAEISCDLEGAEFPAMLEDWKSIQTLMGATPESLGKLEDMLRSVLGVVPPSETEAMWQAAGFPLPVPFFQAFMIRGWHAARR